MNFHEGFQEGFLSSDMTKATATFCAENAEWFELAGKVNTALVRAAHTAAKVARADKMAPEAVATRLLMRSCGAFQGALLLAERAMATEARVLIRSLIENAFCVAALLENPETFMQMLEKDHNASRLRQAKFILAEKLTGDDTKKGKLEKLIAMLDKGGIMSPKEVATLGPLTKLYLAYLRLSNDAAHPSATSLERHVLVAPDRTGWRYRWGAASRKENADTLESAIIAALSIGIGITQLLGDKRGNAAFGPLSDRLQALRGEAVA